MDRVDHALCELHKSAARYYDGPSVAFGYEFKGPDTLEILPRFGFTMVPLSSTSRDRRGEELGFWVDMIDNLSRNPSMRRDDFRLDVGLLQDADLSTTRERGLSIGYLFVSIGTSPSYAEDDNRDGVDAMHDLDRLGVGVLRLGLDHKPERVPLWASASYNFCGIESFEPRVNNPRLAEIVDRLRGQVEVDAA